MIGSNLSATQFKKASDQYILEAVVRGDQFLIDCQFVPLSFLPEKDERVVLRSHDLVKEITSKFQRISEALSESNKVTVNFNPRIYLNEDDSDNDFCDQDPIDVLTLSQLNGLDSKVQKKLSTLEQR